MTLETTNGENLVLFLVLYLNFHITKAGRIPLLLTSYFNVNTVSFRVNNSNLLIFKISSLVRNVLCDVESTFSGKNGFKLK